MEYQEKNDSGGFYLSDSKQRSFLEHAEQITTFRRSQVDTVIVNEIRLDDAGLLGCTRSMSGSLNITDVGGLWSGWIDDISTLVSIPQVAGYRLSQN